MERPLQHLALKSCQGKDVGSHMKMRWRPKFLCSPALGWHKTISCPKPGRCRDAVLRPSTATLSSNPQCCCSWPVYKILSFTECFPFFLVSKKATKPISRFLCLSFHELNPPPVYAGIASWKSKPLNQHVRPLSWLCVREEGAMLQ